MDTGPVLVWERCSAVAVGDMMTSVVMTLAVVGRWTDACSFAVSRSKTHLGSSRLGVQMVVVEVKVP